MSRSAGSDAGWFRRLLVRLRLVRPPLGWPRITRRDGALTGYWRETEAAALAHYVRANPEVRVSEWRVTPHEVGDE